MSTRREERVDERSRVRDRADYRDDSGPDYRDDDRVVDRREERVTEITDNAYAADSVHEDRVTHAGPASVGRGLGRMFSLIILAVLAVVETLLAFRLGFLAGAANPANNFVDFIYDITGWMVDPFEGIITNETFDNGGVFDYATLIAMIVYAVAAALIMLLIIAFTSFPTTGEHTTVSRTAERERLGHGH
jgi:hypothetical protein